MDYLTFIAVLRGAYVGYRSGFFPEILRIAAYLLTVIVAFHFQEMLAQWITLKSFLNYTTAQAVALVVLLGGVFLITKLVTTLLLKLLKIGKGGVFYRLIGLALGAARWVILLSLTFLLIEQSPLASLKTDIHERSLVGKEVSQIAPTLFEFLSRLSPQLGVPKKAP